MEVNSKQLKFLNIAKGIGILLVVFGHIIQGDNFLCYVIYSFHMPLFFIVSGFMESYIYSRKNISIFEYYTKKIQGLFIPYILYSLLYMIYDVIRLAFFHRINIKYIVINVFKTISFYGISVLWFLITLFMASLINKAINCKLKSKWFKILVYACILIFSFLFSYIINEVTWFHNHRFLKLALINIPRTGIGCCFLKIGSLFKYVYFRYLIGFKINFICFVLAFTIIGLLAPLNGFVDLHEVVFNNVFIYFCTSILGTIGVLSLSIMIERISYLSKVFEEYGKNSLLIMTTHLYFPILDISYRIIGKVTRSDEFYNYLVFVSAICLETVLIKIFPHYKLKNIYRNFENYVYSKLIKLKDRKFIDKIITLRRYGARRVQ